jgi:hypothetical protein
VVWKIKLSKRKGKGRGCQGSIARRTPLLERTLWLYYRPPLWLWPYTILWASKMDKIFAHAAVLSDKASHVRLFQDTYVLQCKTWMDQRIESRTIPITHVNCKYVTYHCLTQTKKARERCSPRWPNGCSSWCLLLPTCRCCLAYACRPCWPGKDRNYIYGKPIRAGI